MEFIAACAKSKNYSEFRLLISGRSIANKDLTDEIGRLMEGYSNDHYLPRRYGDHSSIFLDPINELINPQNLVQAWIRAKLYAYCSLFNKLFMYEIHKIYDSWYIDHPNTLDYYQLADTISLVNRIVKKIDDKLEDDPHIHKESYSKSSMEETHKKLAILKQGLASTGDSTDKKEIEQKIKQFENKLEILECVELLGAISPHRDKVLEENRSEEFYRKILNIKISKNKWIDYIKFRLHMVKMIMSFEINKRETNDYLILTTTIIIIAIFLLLLELISW